MLEDGGLWRKQGFSPNFHPNISTSQVSMRRLSVDHCVRVSGSWVVVSSACCTFQVQCFWMEGFPSSWLNCSDPQPAAFILHFLHSRVLRTLLFHIETLNEDLCIIWLFIDHPKWRFNVIQLFTDWWSLRFLCRVVDECCYDLEERTGCIRAGIA